MTFANFQTRNIDHTSRRHSFVLTCACVALLLLNAPFSKDRWRIFDWPNKSPELHEAAIDAALQQAASDALGQREGTIIVIDAQTGRIRALVNSQLANGQALMPGSTMKPFTALAALRAGLIDKDSRTVCPGRFTGRSFSLPCVHEDHLPRSRRRRRSPIRVITISPRWASAWAETSLSKPRASLDLAN